MGVELAGAQRVVARLFDDELEIWRDSAGETDDHLDEVTGQLVAPVPDEELVWSGLGLMMPLGRPAITAPLSGAIAPEPSTADYQAVIPVETPILRPDDVLRVAGSVRPEGARDPQLVGRRFRISDTAVGTYSVVRIVRVQVID